MVYFLSRFLLFEGILNQYSTPLNLYIFNSLVLVNPMALVIAPNGKLTQA